MLKSHLISHIAHQENYHNQITHSTVTKTKQTAVLEHVQCPGHLSEKREYLYALDWTYTPHHSYQNLPGLPLATSGYRLAVSS